MLFNSFDYFVFFAATAGICFLLAPQWRWLWLLLASCYFYSYFIPAYLAVLFIAIIIDYWAGIKIEEVKTAGERKFFLVLSIVSTCALLFVFKYFNFFNTNIAWVAQAVGWNYPIASLSLILPIGLSFHTFQSLSYVIEVYRGHQKAERHFGYYSLYVMFFPQLVAGPIERPQNLLPQLHAKLLSPRMFDYRNVTDGLKLIALGYFKKVVIADRLAVVVNTVYNDPTQQTGIMLMIATVFFGYQIYCDFSGYTDMARGSARVLNIELMENFRAPYQSKSIQEFWHRWHISLSTWFRDYIYIPLGGNRVSTVKQYRNLLIVFLISGLWHGASWTFVLWGLWHGGWCVASVAFAKSTERRRGFLGDFFSRPVVGCLATFVLVCMGWIFFRAATCQDAFYILAHMKDGWGNLLFHVHDLGSGRDLLGLKAVGLPKTKYVINVFLIVFLELIHRRGGSDQVVGWVNGRPVYLRWLIYYVFLAGIILLGEFSPTQFIYFRF